MQIDDCGIHAEKLKRMHTDIINTYKKGGKEITKETYDKIDLDLFNAYQNILFVARDGSSIATALNNLEKMIGTGNVDTTKLSSIATSIAIEAVEENRFNVTEAPENSIVENVATAVVIATAISTEKENKLADEICTPEMEQLHSESYQKAAQGDEQSLEVLDLMYRASNYLVNSDRLNSKGKEAGALALIARLMSTGSKEATFMAQNVAEHFGLDQVMDGKDVSLERVRTRFEEVAPGKHLDKAISSGKENIAERKDGILSRSAESLRDTFSLRIDSKAVGTFLKILRHAITGNNVKLAEDLIRANIGIAKKALATQTDLFDRFISGKKEEPEIFKATRLKLGEFFGKMKQQEPELER